MERMVAGSHKKPKVFGLGQFFWGVVCLFGFVFCVFGFCLFVF